MKTQPEIIEALFRRAGADCDGRITPELAANLADDLERFARFERGELAHIDGLTVEATDPLSPEGLDAPFRCRRSTKTGGYYVDERWLSAYRAASEL